ncbi:MAG: NAD(P)H-binding protein, partial [Gemmatimonadota bacterium]|nr:NAD(P)H-binding protein [Gemmatimonadota bacterium]
MSQDKGKDKLVLVTGASGYVGGRLVPALEEIGARVRCLARNPQYLAGRFCSDTEIVAGDVLDRDSLRVALEGIDTAYYLVHSMGSRANFEEQDCIGAQNFSCAGLQRRARPVDSL